MLGIEPKSDRFVFDGGIKFFQLIERVEDDVITDRRNPLDLVGTVSGTVNVILPIKILVGKHRLKQPR